MDINLDIRIPFSVVTEDQFEPLLQNGFRMMSYFYFRHTKSALDERLMRVKSLRIRLDDFSFTKSQRKILKTHENAFKITTGPINIGPEEEELFRSHCRRFPSEYHNMTIYIFLNPHSAHIPVRGICQKLYDKDKLIAASYIHLGGSAMSATYGIHDPTYSNFSLGHYTMLKEIQLAQRYGLKYYYHGYAYDKPSQFDYKYNFQALEYLNWDNMLWEPHERIPPRNWRALIPNEIEKEQ